MPPPAYARCCVTPRGSYPVGAPWPRIQQELTRRYGPPPGYIAPPAAAVPQQQQQQQPPANMPPEMTDIARDAER